VFAGFFVFARAILIHPKLCHSRNLTPQNPQWLQDDMVLTELAIRQATSKDKPKDKRYRQADGGGLNPQIMPSGLKLL
jgi:hypothetical protein